MVNPQKATSNLWPNKSILTYPVYNLRVNYVYKSLKMFMLNRTLCLFELRGRPYTMSSRYGGGGGGGPQSRFSLKKRRAGGGGAGSGRGGARARLGAGGGGVAPKTIYYRDLN